MKKKSLNAKKLFGFSSKKTEEKVEVEVEVLCQHEETELRYIRNGVKGKFCKKCGVSL